jgi:hypothetical protein
MKAGMNPAVLLHFNVRCLVFDVGRSKGFVHFDHGFKNVLPGGWGFEDFVGEHAAIPTDVFHLEILPSENGQKFLRNALVSPGNARCL